MKVTLEELYELISPKCMILELWFTDSKTKWLWGRLSLYVLCVFTLKTESKGPELTHIVNFVKLFLVFHMDQFSVLFYSIYTYVTWFMKADNLDIASCADDSTP